MVLCIIEPCPTQPNQPTFYNGEYFQIWRILIKHSSTQVDQMWSEMNRTTFKTTIYLGIFWPVSLIFLSWMALLTDPSINPGACIVQCGVLAWSLYSLRFAQTLAPRMFGSICADTGLSTALEYILHLNNWALYALCKSTMQTLLVKLSIQRSVESKSSAWRAMKSAQ